MLLVQGRFSPKIWFCISPAQLSNLITARRHNIAPAQNQSNVELEPHQNVFTLKWLPYWKKMLAMITCHVNYNLWFDWLIVCFGPGYQIWSLYRTVHVPIDRVRIARNCGKIYSPHLVPYGGFRPRIQLTHFIYSARFFFFSAWSHSLFDHAYVPNAYRGIPAYAFMLNTRHYTSGLKVISVALKASVKLSNIVVHRICQNI